MYNMQVLFEGQLNIAELCKGSTADSDSVCLGSNPSSATKNTINGFSRWWYFFLQEQDSNPERATSVKKTVDNRF